MKKKILIIAGGYSNEREISLKTARSVYLELKKSKKYTIEVTEPDGNFVKKINSFKPDIAFNLLHGRYGEDGYIQAILESQKIKYTHSGVLSSSIAIDKEISKEIRKAEAGLYYLKLIEIEKNTKIKLKNMNINSF